MNVITFESADEALGVDFCQWFAGWVDALGQFEMQVNKSGFHFLFVATTTQEQIQVLNYIRTMLCVGNITIPKSQTSNSSLIQFRVTDQAEISKIIVILEEFPPRSQLKIEQLSLWVNAFEKIQRHTNFDDRFYHLMLEIEKKMKNTLEHPLASPSSKSKKTHRAQNHQLALFEN